MDKTSAMDIVTWFLAIPAAIFIIHILGSLI